MWFCVHLQAKRGGGRGGGSVFTISPPKSASTHRGALGPTHLHHTMTLKGVAVPEWYSRLSAWMVSQIESTTKDKPFGSGVVSFAASVTLMVPKNPLLGGKAESGELPPLSALSIEEQLS